MDTGLGKRCDIGLTERFDFESSTKRGLILRNSYFRTEKYGKEVTRDDSWGGSERT